jgi:hypothetical protein
MIFDGSSSAGFSPKGACGTSSDYLDRIIFHFFNDSCRLSLSSPIGISQHRAEGGFIGPSLGYE